VALVLLGVWLVGSRARDPELAIDYVLLLAVFATLGLAHYALIGTRFGTASSRSSDGA
jgi:threonine/homoserine efflux transporter RhtA